MGVDSIPDPSVKLFKMLVFSKSNAVYIERGNKKKQGLKL